MEKSRAKPGFVLIELLLALGLLVLIFGFCVFFDNQNRHFFSFETDRGAVLAAFRRARAMAINSICAGAGCVAAKPHGVHFDPAKKEAVIFQGSGFASRDAGFDEVVPFENRAVYINAPAPFDIIFAPLSGNSASSAIILQDDFGRRVKIFVNLSGAIIEE